MKKRHIKFNVHYTKMCHIKVIMSHKTDLKWNLDRRCRLDSFG